MAESPLLAVEDLRVHFLGDGPPAKAVDGVSFAVNRGETFCLVGESGCGKTVTALAVLGLVPCPPGRIAGGDIRFKGRSLLGLPEEALRKVRGKQIAMVFQEPMTSLNPLFTIGDQIMEAIYVHNAMGEEALRAEATALLAGVGIEAPADRLKDYPHQLSGGQRQRVMIAMALSCRPDLIIADEPTTALDVTVQAQILDLLKQIQSDSGSALLYITHDLGVVASIADRVSVMYAGVIVESAERERLFREARHPYTQGLLASLPTRSKRGKRLYSIPGSVPDPSHKPDGCPFHPRCPHAVETCRERHPDLCDYGGGHRARCPVLYEKWKGTFRDG